jgi:hypothetical protein
MSWITSNVFSQQTDEPLESILKALPADAMPSLKGRRRVAHILNPYRCPPESSGDRVQRITLESFERSRDFAGDTLGIDHIAVVFPEDRDSVPRSFRQAANLDRSVLDLASFESPRKLPLLFDVLERGADRSRDSDFLIFSNMDIVLMPHFYLALSSLLDLGFEAITINRRTIGEYQIDRALSPLMMSDLGQDHGGFDCLVFSTRLMERFIRSDACIGAGVVMRSLLYNLVATARPMLMLKNVHMTFHLGDDQDWKDPKYQEYRDHNLKTFQRLLGNLAVDPEKKALVNAFIIGHKEPIGIP